MSRKACTSVGEGVTVLWAWIGLDRGVSSRCVSRCRPVCGFVNALFVPCLVVMGEEVKTIIK